MSNPQGASYDDAYRPSSRHNLHLPYSDNPSGQVAPQPPPHADAMKHSDTYSPYLRTEDTQLPYQDYNSSLYQAKRSQYSDASRSDIAFQPLHPAQSYQDSPMKRNDYSNVESGYNAPAPPAKRRGILAQLFDGDQRFPIFCWIISIVQVGVIIGEIVRNGLATGSPIEIHPTFNPLIGPSSEILINMGARFAPCMHAIPGITTITEPIWPCLNNTANPPTDGPQCTLSDICGFGGFHGKPPDQWYRVIVPIFLHAGLIHILFNLIVQLRLGADMEKVIGSVRFILVYFPSGIMGFILGANFAGDGVASTGCSGALFGIIALVLLDLLYYWNQYVRPKRQLVILLIQVVICFGLGLLPGLDNFSHIGGFATGLLLGIAIMRPPPRIRARLDNQRTSVYDLDAPYSALTGRSSAATRHHKGLLGYFQGRKGWWWIWNLIRVGCLVLVIVFMALLFNNFYAHGGGHCGWCRYLSCLPVNGWCEIGDITFQNGTQATKMRMI